MKKQFWLADGKDVDEHGTIWKPELIDGPHTSPAGVTQALKIIKGIGLDRGKDRNYVMVTIEPVRELKVKVNQEAIDICKSAVDSLR
jgi:hypothetical protein